MEQLLLKRLTLQERGTTVRNYYYRSSSLIIDVADLIGFLLLIELSIINLK